MLYLIWIGTLMGIGGTVAMDLWAIVLNRVFGRPRPNWGMPGRWVAHAVRGTVFHDDIAQATPVDREVALGWAFHYGVGIIYGIVFAVLAGAAWFAAPTFLPLWLFALVTILAGWGLLHPGMGLGWFLSKTASPWTGRGLGLVAHTVFGLGMWGVVLAL